MNKLDITITDIDAKKRLDVFLSKEFPEYSRNYFSSLIKNENILVNNSVAKPNYKTKIGDRIVGELTENTVFYKPSPENIPLNIIFEDSDVLVINKQPGIVVHPAAGHHDGTLINAILAHDPEIKNAVYEEDNPISVLRPGLVHRLDKDTSGVIIVAKDTKSMLALSNQIQNREVKKIYWGICLGWPEKDSTELTSYLGRKRKNRQLIADIGENRGKKAVLVYKVLKYFEDVHGHRLSLIEFDLKTGRTHQIRVQISDIGCPILGDSDYGDKKDVEIATKLHVKRQLLHAKRLEIALPESNKASVFEAPIPDDMAKLLGELREVS